MSAWGMLGGCLGMLGEHNADRQTDPQTHPETTSALHRHLSEPKISYSLKETSRHILHRARQSQHDYVSLPSWLQSPSIAQSYDCTPVYYSYDTKKYQIHLKRFKVRTIRT